MRYPFRDSIWLVVIIERDIRVKFPYGKIWIFRRNRGKFCPINPIRDPEIRV